jgi:hypothetical protein
MTTTAARTETVRPLGFVVASYAREPDNLP